MLVTWRARRATILRLVAPFLFLLLALIINLALDANNRQQAQVADMPTSTPTPLPPIPGALPIFRPRRMYTCIMYHSALSPSPAPACPRSLLRRVGMGWHPRLRLQRHTSPSCYLPWAPSSPPPPTDCTQDLFITSNSCLTFVYSPTGNPTVEVSGGGDRRQQTSIVPARMAPCRLHSARPNQHGGQGLVHPVKGARGAAGRSRRAP